VSPEPSAATGAPSANASITLPVAVAWGIDGRPTRAIETTLDGDGTKSTVIAASSAGSDSVAVSPVSPASRISNGRASERTSC
jgi:hypothetical protein